jgi:hypothetical protein
LDSLAVSRATISRRDLALVRLGARTNGLRWERRLNCGANPAVLAVYLGL